MSQMNSVVAVFESHDHAEDAIRGLQQKRFDMKNLSSVTRNYHTEQHVVGCYFTGDRMMYWGREAFWDRLSGLLQGSGSFCVAGLGQLLVAGPLALRMAEALEEGAVFGSVTELGAGLFSIGIPGSCISSYETEVKNGKLLVVAHGALNEVELASAILNRRHAQTTTVYRAIGNALTTAG